MQRKKLIVPPTTVVIDAHSQDDSDIDDQEKTNNFNMHAAICCRQNSIKPTLLGGTMLKGRRQINHQMILKEQAICIGSDHQLEFDGDQSNSESVYFVRKVTNEECLKKKLRRQATVCNKVKLERREEGGKQCSICLTDLKDLKQKEIGRLNCKHIFCYGCILQSSKFSNRCPYCRASYSMIRHGNKTTRVQQTRLNEGFDDPMDQPCYICGRNDDFERLLQCEYCEYAYCHTYCDVRLNSDQPPLGNWFCLSCEQMLRNPAEEIEREESIYEDEP